MVVRRREIARCARAASCIPGRAPAAPLMVAALLAGLAQAACGVGSMENAGDGTGGSGAFGGAPETGGASGAGGMDVVEGTGGTAPVGSGGRGTGGTIAGVGGTVAGTGGVAQNPASLKDAAARTGRLMGAALANSHLGESQYAAVARAELSYVTPENEMKWDSTEPSRNVFSYANADAIVAFAMQNGMKVKGHALVWHSQLPGWVSSIGSAEELRTVMINHITQVASHFRGKLAAWDVVNEAFTDGANPTLRNSVFAQQLGAGFIDEAFVAARAADPGAKLYYNDYGTEGMSAKSNAVYDLVMGMKSRGVPIDGVGLQMHTGAANSPSIADLTTNMQRLAALGLDVVLSELDVQICTSDVESQRTRYHDIVAACVAQPRCVAVTTWGFTDKYSWLNGRNCASARGLLFDESYLEKPAYFGVFDALMGR